MAERIKEAREFGDISENAEYDDAKNEQAMLEKQISDLEEKLRNARVIDAKSVDTDVVSVGVTVHVKDQKTDKSTKFKIVGSAEADPADSKLSNESPVGRALLGHKRGETVSVQVPRGPARKLKITKIDALSSSACVGPRGRPAREARAPARAGHRPLPARSSRGSYRPRRSSTIWSPGRRPIAPTAWPAAWSPAATRAARPSSTSSTARGRSSSTPSATCSARSHSTGSCRSTSAT